MAKMISVLKYFTLLLAFLLGSHLAQAADVGFALDGAIEGYVRFIDSIIYLCILNFSI